MLKRQMITETGNRIQSGVSDALHAKKFLMSGPAFRQGFIYAVNTYDTSIANDINSPNRFGKYITYDVILSPIGTILRDIPMLDSSSGFYVNDLIPNSSSSNIQNSDEDPLQPGQPVVIGMIENSEQNAIILGRFPCQNNSGSQTSDEYPQKQGTFQGTSYKIDKNGNPTLNIVANGTLNVEINGVPFLTIDGATNTVDMGPTAAEVNLGAATQPTILGNTLNSYLTSFITTVFNTHTHEVISVGTPTATPIPVATPPSGITTTVVKVS